MNFTVLIASAYPDELPILENLNQILKELSILGAVSSSGAAYQKILQWNPDILIADEALFNAGVNLLCESRDVILLTDSKSRKAAGNIHYVTRPYQAVHLIIQIQRCVKDLSDNTLKERRAQFHAERFPKEYPGFDEDRLRKEDRLEERRSMLEMLQNGTLQFTTPPQKQQGKLTFRSEKFNKLMESDSTEPKEKRALSVVWITRPNKTLYAPGDRISTKGGVVGVAFEDGTSEEVKLSEKNLPEDTLVKDGQTSTVFRVYGKELSLDITVRAKTITGLYISTPCKDVYREGEAPDVSGLELLATWSDGSFGPVKDFEYDRGELFPGNQTLTFYVQDQSVSMPIQVLPITVSGLRWVKKPKTNYDAGDSLDLSDGVLNAKYPDGSEQEIPVTEQMLVTPFCSAPGKQLLLFRLGSCTIPLPILITEKNEPQTLLITKEPDRVRYPIRSHDVTLAGGMLACYWSRGEQEEIPMDSPLVTWTVDLTKTGKAPITITCRGLTATFMLTLTKPKLMQVTIQHPPTRVKYTAGETLDPTGLVLIGTYDNGETCEIRDLPDLPVIRAGDAIVQLHVEGKTVPIHVDVSAKLQVMQPMTKTTYLPGESIDLSGLELSAVYDDGTSIPVSDFYIEGNPLAQVKQHEITISAIGQTVQIPIQVQEKELLSITLSAMPKKIQYLEHKESFTAAGGELLLLYSDHTAKQVPLTNEMVSGFSNETPGQIGLTITYEGKTTVLPVMILARTLTGIGVVEEPLRLEYQEGETFDPEGLKLRAVYNNGETELVQTYSIDPSRPLEPSDTGVVLSFHGKTAAIKITVHESEKIVPEEKPKMNTGIAPFYPSARELRDLD